MAYSSVRVQFEIGHEASVRTKKTPEGFTHDWEVFVRGADSTDIQCFVDKVVFYLHETFPKPRRVIKEPPYVVKESGYAGFVLPIDVYLKNKEEPKKISFQYDLTLQPSGPPISRVLREPRLFQNPSEDFRRKLIRGGGVGVDTPSEILSEDVKSAFSIGTNKIKLTESSFKKHKSDIPANDSFAQLFGTPIRRVPESKKLTELDKKIPDTVLPKEGKKSSKYGLYNDKDPAREKDKYIEKDKNKDREKTKEKSKRSISPPIQQILKLKDEHRRHEEKGKKKEDYDDKKQRKEDKDKREKTKDIREVDKQLQKDHKKERRELKDGDYLKKLNLSKAHEGKLSVDKHSGNSVEKDRPEKEKHKHRHKKKEKEKNRDKEKHKKDKEKIDKSSRDRDKEKEKSNKNKYEEGKEKEEKFKRKSKSLSPGQERLKKGPLNALLDELGSSDSASPLSEEDSIPSLKSLSKPPSKSVPEIKNQNTVNVSPKLKSTNSITLIETSMEKETEKNFKNDEINPLKNKKEKSLNKKVRKFEKDFEKRRAKEEVRARSVSSERDGEDEEFDKEKASKEDRERCEKDRREEEKIKFNKDRESRKRRREKSEEKHVRTKKLGNVENNLTVSQRTGTGTADLSDGPEESRRSDKFTKEYVAQLKDLQHKIMTLEDNSELQKVVKVIAETGQYEITKKTFDFDLCALDFETVKRLQEFFAPT